MPRERVFLFFPAATSLARITALWLLGEIAAPLVAAELVAFRTAAIRRLLLFRGAAV